MLPNGYCQPGLYVADGDSITRGQGLSSPTTQNYAIQAVNLLTNTLRYSNTGTDGATCTSLNASAGDAAPAYQNPIWSIDCGINDLFGGANTPAQAYANLTTYVAARKASGWTKIIVATLIDCGTVSETSRASFNSLVTGGAVANGYTVADFGADATMGCNGCDANTTYFLSDLVHPTTAGHAILAGILKTALNSLGDN